MTCEQIRFSVSSRMPSNADCGSVCAQKSVDQSPPPGRIVGSSRLTAQLCYGIGVLVTASGAGGGASGAAAGMLTTSLLGQGHFSVPAV